MNYFALGVDVFPLKNRCWRPILLPTSESGNKRGSEVSTEKYQEGVRNLTVILSKYYRNITSGEYAKIRGSRGNQTAGGELMEALPLVKMGAGWRLDGGWRGLGNSDPEVPAEGAPL